jgi:Ca2+:H+ antiporter
MVRPHEHPPARLTQEWPLAAMAAAVALAVLCKPAIAGMLDHTPAVVGLLLALCGLILFGSLALVRHAEVLAHRLGEPGGTLLLTMAITGLEAGMVGLVMSSGEEKPALARDTMFAVIMLVLNGYLGGALVLGGVRHSEQPYNPASANAFLIMIVPFSVLSLVLPNFTKASAGPTLTAFQMVFLSSASVALYVVFLLVQNRWHRDFFVLEGGAIGPGHHGRSARPTLFHAVMLALYAGAIILLAKQISGPLDALILRAGAPPALAGFIMAMLVLTPESIAAVRAARNNQLQRSINILLGSVLASIGLTVPIVVAVALLTGRRLVLGLEPVQMVLLFLTLLMTIITFSRPRTNLLLGSVHLLVFAAALMLVFDR